MKPLFIIMFLILHLNANAQKKELTVKDYEKLGREKLIALATKEIKQRLDPNFNPVNFDKILVYSKKEKVTVSFEFPIIFIPMEGSLIYDVSITFPDLNMSHSVLSASDENDYSQNYFFKHTPEIDKGIDFVFNAINKSNEIGHVTRKEWPAEESMTIREKADHYYVEVNNEYTFSHYKVRKSDGEIYEAGHKHYLREENDEREKMKVIK